MRIAILHHDIEPTELKFRELFLQQGCIVNFYDIRKVSEKDLSSYDIVLNRVYSSVASRDFNILNKTLYLLKNLEKMNIRCINSYFASLADYNKYKLFKALHENDIPTPSTIFVGSKKEIRLYAKRAIKEFGFPIVVKRNCGGKSYEVSRVDSYKELIFTLNKMFELAEKQNYKAGFIIQKFIKSTRKHDCRVGVVNGEFLFSYARSFISRNSEDKWMASTSGGSIEFPYSCTNDEIELALKSNEAIGASFSESDIIMAKEGPYVIEVNPTPGYFINSIDDLDRMNLVVQKILNKRVYEELNKIKIYKGDESYN